MINVEPLTRENDMAAVLLALAPIPIPSPHDADSIDSSTFVVVDGPDRARLKTHQSHMAQHKKRERTKDGGDPEQGDIDSAEPPRQC
jgi:hypothetical protein